MPLETYEVTQAEAHPDAGDAYNIECPVCKRTVLWARYGWWKVKCDCGITWTVEVKAIGSDEGENGEQQ